VKTISLFSGVGGMDLGLYRAGFEHVAFCESDRYRREVLARHWPGVPVHDDVRTLFVSLQESGRGA
jgi:DNA (cytosine-5)-methyltransferase 1